MPKTEPSWPARSTREAAAAAVAVAVTVERRWQPTGSGSGSGSGQTAAGQAGRMGWANSLPASKWEGVLHAGGPLHRGPVVCGATGGSCVIPVILSVRGTKAAQAVHSAGEGRGGSRTARPHHQRSVPAAGLCARPCAGAAGQNSAASTCGRRVCAVWQVCVCCVCAVCMCVCVCMLLCVSLWQQLEAASHRGVTD